MDGPYEIHLGHRIGEQPEAEPPCPPNSVWLPHPPLYPSARPRSCLTRGNTRAQSNARGTPSMFLFHHWEHPRSIERTGNASPAPPHPGGNTRAQLNTRGTPSMLLSHPWGTPGLNGTHGERLPIVPTGIKTHLNFFSYVLIWCFHMPYSPQECRCNSTLPNVLI